MREEKAKKRCSGLVNERICPGLRQKKTGSLVAIRLRGNRVVGIWQVRTSLPRSKRVVFSV